MPGGGERAQWAGEQKWLVRTAGASSLWSETKSDSLMVVTATEPRPLSTLGEVEQGVESWSHQFLKDRAVERRKL